MFTARRALAAARRATMGRMSNYECGQCQSTDIAVHRSNITPAEALKPIVVTDFECRSCHVRWQTR